MRVLLLVCMVTLSVCAAQAEGLRVKIETSQKTVTAGRLSSLLVLYNNIGSEPVTLAFVPGSTEYYHQVQGLRVKADGGMIVPVAAEVTMVRYVEVRVGPKERFTCIVPLSSVSRDGWKARRYTAMLRSAGRDTQVVFDIVQAPTSQKACDKTAVDMREVKEELSKADIEPSERLRLLGVVYQNGMREMLWELLVNTDDAYAVVTQLEFLGGEWLDVAGLKKLAISNDVAIRQAAMRALGRLGPRPDAAKWLEAFLKT